VRKQQDTATGEETERGHEGQAVGLRNLRWERQDAKPR